MKNIFNLTLFIVTLCFVFTPSIAQIGILALSPLQELKQTIGKTDVTIVYSRPALRGRIIFGELEPYGKIWRTGANRNTKITFSEEVIINDSRVKPGTYAIFTKPEKDNWQVYFYNETDHWEVPEDFDESKVVAQLNVPTHQTEQLYQSLTILPENLTNDRFDLSIAWEHTKVWIPIQLTTEEKMSQAIADVLSGPDVGDYYQAARYRLESKRDIPQALEWINKAIEMSETREWWLDLIKAECLFELGQSPTALELIASAKQLDAVVDNEFRMGYLVRLEKKIKGEGMRN